MSVKTAGKSKASRLFLAVAAVAAAAGSGAVAGTGFTAPGHDRPNFLVLVADDLTFGALGVAGNSDVRTPHVDRLAARGVRFTHAFIQGGLGGAVCVTSRATLMTGRSLWSCGKNGDCTVDGKALYPLWGRVMGDAGYQTFAVGKWHNGKATLDASFQTTRPVVLGGMLESTPQTGPAYNRPAPGNTWAPDDPRWKGHWMPGDGHTVHSSVRWADAAIDDMNSASKSNRPFFIYVAFHAPHDPRQAPREYLDMYPPASLTLPPNRLPRHPFDLGEFATRDEVLAPYPRTDEVVRTHLREYYAIISHLDTQVGRLLDALDRSGRADNTVVVFTADNGLAVGQHGLLGKQCLYDHSIRVPLILAGPGIPTGMTNDALVYMPSLYATACEMAGVKTPDTVEFPSLVPLITGRQAELYNDIYAGYIDRQRMVRTDRWKLTVTPGVKTVQLFDVRDDPWEQHNLAGDAKHADTLADLRERLARWMKRVKDPIPVSRLDAAFAAYRDDP